LRLTKYVLNSCIYMHVLAFITGFS
jgi:hypothetical protein